MEELTKKAPDENAKSESKGETSASKKGEGASGEEVADTSGNG
jgi:hypothetical protein